MSSRSARELAATSGLARSLRFLFTATFIEGQANSALNVQGGASPFPVPDLPQFPVRCPLGSLHRARSVFGYAFGSEVKRSVEHSGCIACQTARYPSSSTSAWGAAKDCGLAVASMIRLSITSTTHSQRRRYSAREAAEAAVSVRIRISPQIVQSTAGVSEQSPPPGSAHEDTFSRA